MALGHRSMMYAVTALTVLVPMLCAVDAAVAAEGPAGEVVMVDLPSEARVTPRHVQMIGRTDDGHLVMQREVDVSAPLRAVETKTIVVAPDGSQEVLDTLVDGVAGNRLVDLIEYADSVRSRQVDGSTWSTINVPERAEFLDYTADGVVVATPSAEGDSITLLPWDGGAATAISGLPAGGWVRTLTPQQSRLSEGSVTVLYGGPKNGRGSYLLVDTAARQTWAVETGDGDCRDANAWGLHGGRFVWQTGGDGNATLCSVDVPVPGAETVGPISTRSSATVPLPRTPYMSALVPIGDDVVVSTTSYAGPDWGREPERPLLAVAADGSTRKLATWAYAVLPSGDGHLVAVTGDGPGQQQVSDIDVASGDVTEVSPVAPVRAWRSGIAIDGGRVVSTDDSAVSGAVRERTVDFDAETVGPSTLLDSDVTGPVAAGAGSSAWSKRAGVVHLTSDGTRTTSSLGDVLETDERWVRGLGGQIVDTVTGQYRPWTSGSGYGALLDGVAYVPGYATQGGPKNSVIATDLDTSRSAAMAVDGCVLVSNVQVAGSWMLVQCTTASGDSAEMVVDRSGGTAQWQLDAPNTDLHLGNGFIVSRSLAGELAWTPLTGTSASWRPLGAMGEWDPTGPDWDIAVSRGNEPTVAWIDGTKGFAARLPVATSPLPAHPDGTAPPASLSGVQLAGVDGAIYVYWDRPATAEAVTSYTITATARHPYASTHVQSVTVGASATSAALRQLSNGYAYDVTITTYNIAGWTRTTAAEPATPLPRPSAPSDVQVSVDQAHARATVTWSYAQGAGTEPVRSFSVESELAVVDDLPADARSATFDIPRASVGVVSVIAQGVAQSSAAGHSPVTSFHAPPPTPVPPSAPAPDVVAPATTLGPLPAVVLDGALRLDVGASDDRALAVDPIEIRWRAAEGGERLGDWTVPARWKWTQAGTKWVHLVPGQAACVSARARDAYGNLSPWSEQRCSVAAYDDRALRAGGGARRVTGKGYFRRGATVLGAGRSAYLQTRVTSPATGGWLVARTCPSCGRVKVVIGSTVLGTIDLRSKVTRDQRLLPFPWSVATPQRGRLRLTSTGHRGDVVIDGFALRTY